VYIVHPVSKQEVELTVWHVWDRLIGGIQNFDPNTLQADAIWKTRCRLRGNIKMDLQGLGWEVVD